MCTVILLRQMGDIWPLILAANRDESLARPWAAPARHWPDRPDVVAGLDHDAGGSWFGLNDHGVAAAVLNQPRTLGPDSQHRSRGELVLEALDHGEAAAAAEALAHLEGRAWRGFHLLVADAHTAWWLYNRPAQDGRVLRRAVPPGLSVITAAGLDHPDSPRARALHRRFATLPSPAPMTQEDWTQEDWPTAGWRAWEQALGSHDPQAPEESPCVHGPGDFGTVNSVLVALTDPARRRPWGLLPPWAGRFAPGAPDVTPFAPLTPEAPAPHS